jgi:hypothetical protein
MDIIHAPIDLSTFKSFARLNSLVRVQVEKEGRIFLFFSKFVLFLAQQNKGEIAESGDEKTCSSVVFVDPGKPQRVKRLLERTFW